MKDLRRKFRSLFKDKNPPWLFAKFWPLLVIFILVLVFFYPVWIEGKIPLPVDALVGAHVPWIELKWEEYPAGVPIKNLEISDSFSQFYPWRSLVGEFWRAGKAPLWNSYMFSGTPFLATLHSAALYPLNFIYLFLSDANAWTVLVFLQVLLAAVFMYLFLVELGLRKEASLLGAIAFSFSGYMIAWLEFATGGHAGLWLPLLLLFEYKLVKSEKPLWVLPISFVFFAIFTAGDFQVPLYIGITYLLFGIYLAFHKNKTRKSILQRLFPIFGGLVLGVLLSLPQILPAIELFLQSVRIDDPYIGEYLFGLMHWEKVVNFVWPDFFGNVVTRNYWGKFGFHEYMGFTGVVALVFATYGLFVKKDKTEKFFWILLIVSVLFLFPTPLGFLPYKLKIPALGTSSASRIIFLVDFCLAALAAYGFSKWLKLPKSGVLKVVFYLLVLSSGVALGLIISIYVMKAGSSLHLVPDFVSDLTVSLRNMIPSTLVLLAIGLLFFIHDKVVPKLKIKPLSNYLLIFLPFAVLFVATAELLRFAWKSTPFSPTKFLFPRTQIIKFLEEQPGPFRIAGGIPTNLFMPHKISSAEGYDPMYPMRNALWFSATNFGNLNSPSRRYGLLHNFSSPLIDYANVKFVIDYKKNIYRGVSERGNLAPGVVPPRYIEVFSEGRIKVFENTQSLPRVWLSTNYKVLSDPQQIIDELVSFKGAEDKLIVVESEPKIPITRDRLDYTFDNFRQAFNKISFSITTSDNALLFLSESYSPGWRAFVDGRETEILRANYISQALAISKGKHVVRFIYYPESFKIGKYISAFTAIFLATMFSYERFFKKRIKTSRKHSP